jgi:hypothetical protein
MSNLTCGDCGYQNEPERVYCHNCGAKLDRSVLPKPDDAKKNETPEKARKRIARMANPTAGGIGREVKALAKTLSASASVALLFLVAMKPDGVPEDKRELADRIVTAELSDAVNAPRPVALAFTETEVNASLRQSVKFKDPLLPGVEVKRMYVKFHPGKVHVALEQAVFGYSVYSGVEYEIAIGADGALDAKMVGGNYGRAAIHPAVMQYVDFAFKKLWIALKRERDHMDKMQRIDVSKERIVFYTKGAVAL